MVALIGIIVFLSIVLELMLWNHYNGHAKDHMTQNIDRMNKEWHILLREQVQGLNATLQIIALDSNVKKAMQEANGQMLLETWKSKFDAMQKETRITHFTFYDANRKALMRLHNPKYQGDIVNSALLLKLQRMGNSAWGLEVDANGVLSLNAVYAVYNDTLLLGYIELGKGIENTLKLLQKNLQSELAVLVHKHQINQSEWEEDLLKQKRSFQWNSFFHSVLAYTSIDIPPRFIETIENSHDYNTYKEVAYNGIQWLLYVQELSDTTGKSIGDLVIMHNINDIKVKYYTFVMQSGIVGVLLILFVIIPIYILLRKANGVFEEKQEVLNRLNKIASRISGFIYQYRLRPDGTSCFPFASEGIRQIYRFSPDELKEDASKVFSILHPDDLDGIVSSIRESANTLIPWQYEYRVKFNDGTIRWLYGNAIPEKEEDGSVLWHGYIDDISDRKFMENELKALNEFLDAEVEKEVAARVQIQKEQESERQMLIQKSKLSSMGEMMGAIAHQWRQPLNALNINIQNLDDDCDEGLIDRAFMDEFIKKNKQIILFMSKTIDDFRNFFKIDKEKKEFSALESIYETIGLQMAQLSNHSIRIDVDGEDVLLFGFKGEFQQVILNIINNAKDTILEQKISGGRIRIFLAQKEILIENNGGNIQESVLERIFEPYYTTKAQGVGIGLYMSKVIIEKNMGWKLTAANVPNGARFTIIF